MHYLITHAHHGVQRCSNVQLNTDWHIIAAFIHTTFVQIRMH